MTVNDTPARSPRWLVVIGVVALASSGTNFPSNAQEVDWGQKSALLNLDLTEQQVVQTAGYLPNKVEMKTYGQESQGGAWTCKIYTFGNSYYHLTIHFRQDRGLWVVNSWHVFP
jgi:hypothetical protein